MRAETDKTVDMDIDWDAEVPCVACERGAEWIARFPCGGCADILCSAHKAEQEQRHSMATLFGQTWECKRHRIPVPHPLPWRPL